MDASAVARKRALLSTAYFGDPTAEFDQALHATFVETDIWAGVIKDQVNIVLGAKGTGKSAMYSLLFVKRRELRKRRIVVVGAESLEDDPIFVSLSINPTLSEEQFATLWKLYFLALVGGALRSLRIRDASARRVISVLEGESLLPRADGSLFVRTFNEALRYVNAELEGEFGVSGPSPVQVRVSGRIVLHEPTAEERQQGKIGLNELLTLVGKSLTKAKLAVWLLVDRLDMAFPSDEALEIRALRALFRAYISLGLPAYGFKIKLFVRADTWDRLTRNLDAGGRFPGANMLNGTEIRWSSNALLNLVVRRILHNEHLCRHYGVKADHVRADYRQQEALFARVFPEHVETDAGIVKTFEWILQQIRDGTGNVAPRELILMLSYAREAQLQRLDLGIVESVDEHLFDQNALKIAAAKVSDFRLYRTLFTEYPYIRSAVDALRGGEASYTVERLERLWRDLPWQVMTMNDTHQLVDRLTALGFFEVKSAGNVTMYHVPPIYQHALALFEQHR